MAGRGPQSFKKRQKEQQRKEKQQEKLAKRIERRNAPPDSGDPDPDDINPLDEDFSIDDVISVPPASHTES
jgi:hypothetical protein